MFSINDYADIEYVKKTIDGIKEYYCPPMDFSIVDAKRKKIVGFTKYKKLVMSLNKEIDMDFVKESELIEDDGISQRTHNFLSHPDTKLTLIINVTLDEIEQALKFEDEMAKENNIDVRKKIENELIELKKNFCQKAEIYAVNDVLDKQMKFKYNGHLFALRNLFYKAKKAKRNKNIELGHDDIVDTNFALFDGTPKAMSSGIGSYRSPYVSGMTFVDGANWRPESNGRVDDAMNGLLEWYNNQSESLHPIVRAAILHTEFIRIHPFADGNGRTARLLTSYELVKHGYPSVVIKAKDRQRYFDAINKGIETKDVGDLVELIQEAVLTSEDKFIERVEEINKQDKLRAKLAKNDISK